MAAGTRHAVADDAGVRHEVNLLPVGGMGLLRSTWTPIAERRGALLICSSLFNDVPKNQRREVLLARSLSAQGVTVRRFDYRGTGNSEGEQAPPDLDSLVHDARNVGNDLIEEYGAGNVAYLGVRLGAFVAAALGGDTDSPIALWEPIVDPKRWVRDAFRAQLMSMMRHSAGDRPSAESLRTRMHEQGSVDVLGYQIDETMVRSIETTDLASMLGIRPRPLLLMQFGRKDALRPEYASFTAARRADGFEITTGTYLHDEPWWFTEDVRKFEDAAVTAAPLLAFTEAWIMGHICRTGETP